MADKELGCVLVVDDQENWRALIQAVLEESGYMVSTASSYEQATALIQHTRFNIAILDMRLVDSQPYNVQGMALLKRIKASYPTTSALILTGYPDAEHKDRALRVYQADAYLEKAPEGRAFDVDGFSQLIRSLMDKTR